MRTCLGTAQFGVKNNPGRQPTDTEAFVALNLQRHPGAYAALLQSDGLQAGRFPRKREILRGSPYPAALCGVDR